MALYRRFVTYLFEYEEEKKGRNCGFAKVDARQDRCRMEVQMQGCADGEYRMYLLHYSGEETAFSVEGVPIGDLRVRSGFGKEVFLFPAENIGETTYRLSDFCGLYLSMGEAGFVASQWEDGELDWGSFHIYKHPDTSGMDRADDGQTNDDSIGLGEDKKNAEDDQPQPDPPEVQATQTAAAADFSPYVTAWENQWQRFCARHPVFCPFDEAQDIYAVKADLRDLRSLPKQYWQLANNSFLLHGYFNYKYILFGCVNGEKKKWFVAVPGVFQNQEQMLAGIFGFPDFRTKHVTKQKTGEFGFWYRYLDKL